MEENTQAVLRSGDYRFQIVEKNGIACLHVMIDPGEAHPDIFRTHIPLDDIQKAIENYRAQQTT